MIYILSLILVINFLILRKLYQPKIQSQPTDNKQWMSFVNCHRGTFLIHKFQRDKNINYDGRDGLTRCIVASGVGYICNEKNEKKYSRVEIQFWSREVSNRIPLPVDKKIGDLSLNSIFWINVDCSGGLFEVLDKKVNIQTSIIKSGFTFVYNNMSDGRHKDDDLLGIKSFAADIVGLHSMTTESDFNKYDIEMEFNSEDVKGKFEDEYYFKECESLIDCIQN
jgi:hypothetical protein